MGVSSFTCEARCIHNSVSYFNFRTADGICSMNYGFALMEQKITLCKAINGNIKASLRNNCDICGEITCMYCSSGSNKDSYKKSKEMVCILEDIRDVLGDMQAGRLKLKK